MARVRDLVRRESMIVRDSMIVRNSMIVTGSTAWLQCLCRAAVRALPATGTGINVITSEGGQGLAAASDPSTELIEELQFTLGEGPCIEAYSTGRPVGVADLGGLSADRWPAYSRAVRAQGVAAVFAFPLKIGTAQLGVMDVYRERPGDLSPAAFGAAKAFADVALMGLLDSQESTGNRAAEGFDHAFGYRVEVYQAQGMIQVQLGVSSAEALVRLRAHAYASGRRIGEIAHDVVARRLILERDN